MYLDLFHFLIGNEGLIVSLEPHFRRVFTFLGPLLLFGIVRAQAAVIELPIDFSNLRVAEEKIDGQVYKVDGQYIAPNETMPENSLPFLAQAPEGFYGGVGSERLFMSAAITPGATGIVGLDWDRGIPLFIELNAALMRSVADGDLDGYRTLRFGDFSTWRNRVRVNELSPSVRTQPLEALHKWWSAMVAQNPEFDQFHASPADGLHAFKNSNYLFDRRLFTRLQEFAKADRIRAFQVDLTEKDSIDRVVGALKTLGITLSVLDLSNAYYYDKFTPARLGQLLETCRSVTLANSLLLLDYGPWPLGHQLDDPRSGLRTRLPIYQSDSFFAAARFDKLRSSGVISKLISSNQNKAGSQEYRRTLLAPALLSRPNCILNLLGRTKQIPRASQVRDAPGSSKN